MIFCKNSFKRPLIIVFIVELQKKCKSITHTEPIFVTKYKNQWQGPVFQKEFIYSI
jgi:hypothetical protein